MLGEEQQAVWSALSARDPGLNYVDCVWDAAGVRRRTTVDGDQRDEVELELAGAAEATVADDRHGALPGRPHLVSRP